MKKILSEKLPRIIKNKNKLEEKLKIKIKNRRNEIKIKDEMKPGLRLSFRVFLFFEFAENETNEPGEKQFLQDPIPEEGEHLRRFKPTFDIYKVSLYFLSCDLSP